jgi:predicted Zn-dependent peptidase
LGVSDIDSVETHNLGVSTSLLLRRKNKMKALCFRVGHWRCGSDLPILLFFGLLYLFIGTINLQAQTGNQPAPPQTETRPNPNQSAPDLGSSIQLNMPTTQRALNATNADDAGAALRQRVVEYRLPNGMLFLLVHRTGAPTFSAYIRVKAGGVDEQIGYTGLAHIFEHVAFKGNSVVGSRDWQKEEVLLRRINHVGEALSVALIQSQGQDNAVTKSLRQKLQQLQAKHKTLVNTDEFSRIYEANGSADLNATTSKDLTSYFVSLPSNRLALWAYQEAARLYAPVFREYYRERDVVAEERRMAMSQGDGRLYENFIATAFLAHPYRFPTLGWMSDITTLPLEKVRQFFYNYYNPSNMVAAIVGDIDLPSTKALLNQTFGLIPAGSPPPPVRTIEPKQQGERRSFVEFHTHPQIMIGFHKPTAPHIHDSVFDVIEGILTQGPSSRLKRALVNTRMAQDIWASSLPGARYPNLFTISAKPIAPHNTDKIEEVVYRELQKLQKTPVPESELQKVRNSISMSFLRNIRSNNGLAAQLSYFQAVVGDWRYATQHDQRISQITPQMIMEVAKIYFQPHNRTVAVLKQIKRQTNNQPQALNPISQTPTAQAPTTQPKPRNLLALPNLDQAPATRPVISAELSTEERVKILLDSITPPSATVRELPTELRKHPKLLRYGQLDFQPPKPRIVKLDNGMVLYLLEDRELPLVDIHVLIEAGRLYDPPDKIGLAEIAGEVLRTGGFAQIDGDSLDEQLDFRAAHLKSEILAEYGTAHLSIHRRDLKWGLQTLSGVLRQPRFAPNKIALKQARMLEQYRRHNDDPFQLAFRHFRKLVYGENSRWSQHPTPDTIKAITRQDLINFHQHYYRPRHLRLAIVGDFRTDAMLAQLRDIFGSWRGERIALPQIAPLPERTQPTIAVIRQRIPQSIILAGHLAPHRKHPQWMSGLIMNQILGGGGFSSRLMTEIRTQRGLAYFAGSQIIAGPERSMFLAYTGTQPTHTTQVLEIMLDILKKIHKTGEVSPEELQLTRDTLLNRFIFLFRSPAQIVYRQAYYDYFQYPPDYLESYRKRLISITHQDVAKAAKLFLDPSQLAVLIIGWDPAFRSPPLSKFGDITYIHID